MPAPTVDPGRGDGFDTELAAGSRWTTAGIAEALPDVLPPLVWETAAPLYDDAFRALFGRRGGLGEAFDDAPVVARTGGRAVLSLDAVEAATRAAQRGRRAGDLAVAELDRQYLGERAVEPRDTRPVRTRSRRGTHRTRDRVEAETVAVAAEAVAGAALPSTWDGLVRRRARLVDLGHRAVVAETVVAADAAGAYRRLEALLRRSVGYAAPRWAQRLTASPPTAHGGPEAAARRSHSVFAGPTWAEVGLAPAPVAQSGTAAAVAWDHLLEELDGSERRAVRALTGQLVDLRLVVLRRAVEDTVELLAQRERTKLAVLAVGGEVRRVHRALAADLVAAGVLASVDDVDLLGVAELLGRRPRPDRRALQRRRAWQEMRLADPVPPLLVVGGAPTAVPAAARPSAATDRFTGVACSPGALVAPARVVRDPLVDEIEPGDVLVATTTDPSWQPLFLAAGAVVVERGGPLSHAAILARELGIPAVLGIAGIVDALQSRAGGVALAVDGDAGTVEIRPAAEPATARLSTGGADDAH